MSHRIQHRRKSVNVEGERIDNFECIHLAIAISEGMAFYEGLMLPERCILIIPINRYRIFLSPLSFCMFVGTTRNHDIVINVCTPTSPYSALWRFRLIVQNAIIQRKNISPMANSNDISYIYLAMRIFKLLKIVEKLFSV